MVKKRFYWVDILKIIACLFVVINHISLYLFDAAGYTDFSQLFYSIIMGIVKICVPLFLMITGYLLLSKETDYKYILKKLFRIVVPLVVMTVIYSYFYYGADSVTILGILKRLLKGPVNFSLWYLYALMGVYLSIPFIKKMMKDFKDKDYNIFLICFLLIPSVFPIISKKLHFEVSEYFLIGSFTMIISYVVAGYYFCKLKLNKRMFIIAIVLFLISSLFSICAMYLPYLEIGILSYTYDSWNNLYTVIASLSFFYIIRYLFENKKFKEKTNEVISNISGVTFGIYLVHIIFADILYGCSFVKNIFLFNSYLGIICFYIICFLFSGLVSYFLKLIPGVRKFL